MAKKFKRNLVTWTPDNGAIVTLALRLEGDLVRTAGMKPDIVTASVTYKEFDKLGGDLDRAGKLEFWYQGAPGELDEEGQPVRPQLTLAKWRLVEAEAAEGPEDAEKLLGMTPSEAQRAYKDLQLRGQVEKSTAAIIPRSGAR